MNYQQKYLKYKKKYKNLTKNQIGGAPDIRVRLENGTWVKAFDFQASAFNEFVRGLNANPVYIHRVNNGLSGEARIEFNIQRDGAFGEIYIYRPNGTRMPIADFNAVPVNPKVWFDKVFGFQEMGPGDMPVVRRFLRVEDVEGRKILVNDIGGSPKRLNAGIPLCLSVGKLLESVSPLTHAAVVGLSYYSMPGDIKNFHMDGRLANSLFQVASQFNALEMVSPEVTPEEGITKYQNDRTQGPVCAMACPYGTVYRNYFSMPGSQPQTRENQLNTLRPLTMPPFSFNLREENGYVFPESKKEAQRIERILQNRDNFFSAMNLVEYFIQGDTTVVNSDDSSAKELHRVSQIYCSALPLAYFPEQLGDCPMFLNMILHSVYYSTLAHASHMARIRGDRVKVFLTRVGGGVFGNKDEMINAAIKSATNFFSSEPIDVIMVNFKANQSFTKLDPSLSINPQKELDTGNEFVFMPSPQQHSMSPGSSATQYPPPPSQSQYPPPPSQSQYPPPPSQSQYPPPHQSYYSPSQSQYPPPSYAPPPSMSQGAAAVQYPPPHQSYYSQPQSQSSSYAPPPSLVKYRHDRQNYGNEEKTALRVNAKNQITRDYIDLVIKDQQYVELDKGEVVDVIKGSAITDEGQTFVKVIKNGTAGWINIRYLTKI